MEEPKRRKDTRTHLTQQQKAQLHAFLAANPKLPQFAVADWVREHFHVRLGRTTVYRIQKAAASEFTTGNLSRKKRRSVKFPDFERRLLAFYEERRARREDITDEELLRHASECRAACGIDAAQLKLSNGWLYRFKIRHQLTSTQTRAGLERSHEQGQEDRTAATIKTGEAVTTLSARALTTVQAPAFFNWEPTAEVQQTEIAIVEDGLLVLQPGVYELTVQVQHSALVPGALADGVFKVYCGDDVVGQCEAPVRVQNDVASSVWMETNLVVETQAVLKVEFIAPGYAFTDSCLLLRRRIQ
ncbi:unnamed protein product [Phytophthora lilii]|uniref:Unnamed protein product n=1 Tax=Phytophthora lilii TaxID=2077276 RepID=A0A9W7CJH8_9STRA|nr:unnamed protein product [Phytophthora lilii]